MKNKKTKIVATIGPASESEENLKAMMIAGMNVARLNFSHGEHSWHQMAIERIRKVANELQKNIGIIADLQGPRIRIKTDDEVEIKENDIITVYDLDVVTEDIQKLEGTFFGLDKRNILNKLKKGQDILIEDGLMNVQVVDVVKDGFVKAKVITGGVIKNHKGVNIPGADLDIDVITEKDKKDLDFVLGKDVDFVAFSFVKNAENIKELRQMIAEKIKDENNRPQIISKIERKEAIDNLDEVIEESDAVMVARGDLGIEMDTSSVVVLQKKIIDKSLESLTPVIVATQMLDSMIENARPTRAEISDVTNAVIDHTDAVMLSGESASGKYPVESVLMMKKIIENTETSIYDDIYKALSFNTKIEYATVIRSAYELANSFDVKALCMISATGFTARLISHFRPEQRMLIATNNPKTFRQFSLLWGVEGRFFSDNNLEKLIDKIIADAKQKGELKKDDKIVVVIGRYSEGEKMRLVGVKKIA